MAKGKGGLLAGLAAGAVGAKRAQDRKSDRAARVAAAEERRNPTPPAEQLAGPGGPAAPDYDALPEQLAGPDERYADGGKVDTSKRRKQLDSLEEDALKANGGVVKGYADGGELGVTYSEKPEQEKMGSPVSGKKVENRDAGKRPPTPSPVIGVRADAAAFKTEIGALMANGGMVPEPIGYATGGLLLGNNIPGGYTQHGSITTTSDPLWHMECHRDFGKKG